MSRMLYPRVDKKGNLVDVDQMVTVGEHLMSKHRLVFLSGVITGSPDMVSAMYAMDSLSSDPIKLDICSPGGDLEGALLLYDTIRTMRSPVYTFGRYAASAAVILLAAGAKRYLSPHSLVMLHLPSGQMLGDFRDWDIQMKEMEKFKDKMVDALIASGVKRSKKKILADIDRDFYLSPAEAIDYGLADEVMSPQVMREWLS